MHSGWRRKAPVGRPRRRPHLAPWSTRDAGNDGAGFPWPNVEVAARFASFVLFGSATAACGAGGSSRHQPPPSQAALLLLCGLPGTGKSYLARELADRLPLLVVSSDRVRQLLFTRPTYSAREHGIVHGVCYRLVSRALQQGCTVVYDATNLRSSTRRRYAALAREHRAIFQLIVTEATEATARERLRRRTRREVYDGSEADEAVYEQLRGTADDVGDPHLRVQAPSEVETVLAQVAVALRPNQMSTSSVS